MLGVEARRIMDLLLLALTIGLPLLKFVLFPARAVGRGGGWTIAGAVMIVGFMMLLFFTIQSFTGTPTSTAQAKSAPAASPSDQQEVQALHDLASLLQNPN
jgi:hypothetical protein